MVCPLGSVLSANVPLIATSSGRDSTWYFSTWVAACPPRITPTPATASHTWRRSSPITATIIAAASCEVTVMVWNWSSAA
ncbi:hypothetical protein [Mycolicibacterium pyrenivorans]|uniref:hypothetical protein n=1 Tax=Mycolicibacterium pyrenivorans TaxID=187102 RepID=UPI0021F2FBD6|nr:hypothetical protein [Mycolicibacterium pyrenivorans]